MVLREGLSVVLARITAGAMGAFAAVRVTSRFFGEAPPLDLSAIPAVPCVLVAVVLTACYLPARRAARVDPMVALRQL
jgi:putative ABC transport system permease protein